MAVRGITLLGKAEDAGQREKTAPPELRLVRVRCLGIGTVPDRKVGNSIQSAERLDGGSS
jgi:hypothetical protein